MVHTDGLRVVESELRDGALVDVPADGQTMGEIVMRGNGVMKGYFTDPEGTERAFAGGWFHSGDLGVMHPDGYVELRDRAKDVVVSGGENIATVEVEHAVASHAAVLEVAVVGVPAERWGERPKAFVVIRPGGSVSTAALLQPSGRSRPLQGTPRDRVPDRAAQDLHGQDPEVRPAREGMVRPRPPDPRLTSRSAVNPHVRIARSACTTRTGERSPPRLPLCPWGVRRGRPAHDVRLPHRSTSSPTARCRSRDR